MANKTTTKQTGKTAAQKKTATGKGGTNKKSPPKKTSGKQTNNTKQPSKQQNSPERTVARRQVVSCVLFAAALFLGCVTIVPSGVTGNETNIWQGLKDIFFGLFGVCAFTVPLMLFYTAYVLAKDKPLNGVTLRICGIASFSVCLSSILHIASNEPEMLKSVEISEQIKAAWSAGLTITNGGASGALLGGAFSRMFGKAGGLITLAILLFALIMLLTGISLPQLFALLAKPFSKATDYTQNRIERKHEREQNQPTAETDDGFVPPQDTFAKTPKGYRKPVTEEVFEEKTVTKSKKKDRSNGFFNDDFDPMPGKTDEPVEPIETAEKNDITEIPVFSPPPNGVDVFESVHEDELPEAEQDNPIEEAADLETQVPAQDVIELIDKAAQMPEDSVVQQIIESPQDEIEHKHKYVLPGVDCLVESQSNGDADIKDELTANAQKLVETLRSFNIETKIVDIARGPSVTRYEIQPAPGIKISRIAGLADDIAMNLAASGVRIEAPIPNKAAVGIEIPNRSRTTVTLREIVDSPQFKNAKSKLNVALGKDISGNVSCTDLAKMPHLLIAGTTGSGKSVCLNAMIISILFNSTPDEVKLLMIDPKQVEFTVYNGIPHLMVPVVSDARKAAGALAWAVSEMLKRYKMFSEKGVRDITGYNKLAAKDPEVEPMYQICIFIDELSDLMMVAQDEVEDSICRLAQMARAAGMHLVIATQRPSVNVITGIIKANIPSRIALYVSSQVDSRTILDVSGAEKLLGNGDMLFNPVGVSKPVRLQGCFVSDEEVERVVDFIKTQEECEYDDEVMEEIERQAVIEKKSKNAMPDADSSPDSGADEETMRAIAVVVENQLASTTLLQRKLKIGYAKAARIMDELEEKGIIGPFEGSKPRKVLMSKLQFNEMRALNDDTSYIAVDTTGFTEE